MLGFSKATLKAYQSQGGEGQQPQSPKGYQLLYFIDSHEFTLKVIEYLDDHLLSYLQFLEKEGHLAENLVLLHADHGFHQPPFNGMGIGPQENGNFMLHALYPKKLVTKRLFETAIANQQRLVSQVDVHQTLMNIATDGQGDPEWQKTFEETTTSLYKSRYDLFQSEIPLSRMCEGFLMLAKSPICICDKYME